MKLNGYKVIGHGSIIGVYDDVAIFDYVETSEDKWFFTGVYDNEEGRGLLFEMKQPMQKSSGHNVTASA